MVNLDIWFVFGYWGSFPYSKNYVTYILCIFLFKVYGPWECEFLEYHYFIITKISKILALMNVKLNNQNVKWEIDTYLFFLGFKINYQSLFLDSILDF